MLQHKECTNTLVNVIAPKYSDRNGYSDVLLTNRIQLKTGRRIPTAEIEKAVENLYT